MYFDGNVTEGQVSCIPCDTELTKEEVYSLITSIIRKD